MMADYTAVALESLLSDSKIYRNETASRLLAESEFILSSMEEGRVVDFLQEATVQEIAKKVLDALRQFLNSIVSKYKSKVAEYYKNYVPWVNENADRIREAAKKGSLTLAPYWKGNVSKDTTEMTNLPKNAFKYPYEDGDISFAKNILSSISKPEDLDDTSKLANMLKNKFRFGVEEADNSKIKKEELKENDLASKVEDMIKYVTNYKNTASSLEKISNSCNSSAEAFQKAVTESAGIVTKDKFILIEMCQLAYTDLSLMEGFDKLPKTLMEETNTDGKENTSLTTVENNAKEESGGKPTSGNNQGRYKLADKFVRLAISAFMTACEERFVVYIKCMSQILGESPKKEKKK